MPEAQQNLGVVLVGHGSEYALGPLASALRTAGYECVELDTAVDGWRNKASLALRFGRRVLFSSQHPYVNRSVWKHHYGYDTDIIDLPEAIELLKPERVFYVPHDLSCPIKHEEIVALAYCTAALMPDDAYWHLGGLTRIYDAGWIGALPAQGGRGIGERRSVIFLPSEIAYFKRAGLPRFLELFEPILKMDVVVKFPVLDGVDAFESAVSGLGVKVLKSTEPASVMIRDCEVVISNGMSSVIAEAVLHGRSAVCVLDGIHGEVAQREFFSSSKDRVHFCAPSSVATEVAHLLASSGAPDGVGSKRFDFELVLRLLEEA